MSTVATYPKLKIALTDQKPSGYIREDTLGTANPIEKSAPGSFYIPEKGGYGIRYMRRNEKNEKVEIDTDEALDIIDNKKDGWDKITSEKYAIQYIKGCPEIAVDWQKENKWEASVDPHADLILVEDGYLETEYNFDPARYHYLKESLWFQDLRNREKHATPNCKPMYYEVKESKKDIFNIGEQLAINKAMQEWEKLVMPGKKNTFTVNEDKVNGYASLLGVQGQTPTEKLTHLLTRLKADPAGFLEKVIAYQEETVTTVSHAENLGLVTFEGNDAILSLGTSTKRMALPKAGAKISKLERLAELMNTADQKETYTLLKSHIELAKEKQLN